MKSRGYLTPLPENAVAVPEEAVAVLMSPSVLCGKCVHCVHCVGSSWPLPYQLPYRTGTNPYSGTLGTPTQQTNFRTGTVELLELSSTAVRGSTQQQYGSRAVGTYAELSSVVFVTYVNFCHVHSRTFDAKKKTQIPGIKELYM